MDTATGRIKGRAAKPDPSGKPADVYDPHFPSRQRSKDAAERVRTETFDPHFPPLKQH
jgi:inosine/xanthosine triphosphate pyrophosphatase family protein